MKPTILGEINSLSNVEFLNLLSGVGDELKTQASGRGLYEAAIQLERLVYACKLLTEGMALRGKFNLGAAASRIKQGKLRDANRLECR